MAIQLITGQPGHGKSLLAIVKGLEFVKQGRMVYASGFKELDYAKTGFQELPERFNVSDVQDKDAAGRVMPKWQLLPHGAVIILDECYDMIPQRAAGARVPPHVDALARHRHHGYDIILVCQQHNQIDSFVKGLIDTHIHVRRKFGLHRAVLKTWDRFQSNTAATDTLSAPIWKYPANVFDLYTSATMHTVKRKIPWFIWAVPVLFGILGFSSWYAYHGITSNGKAQAQGQGQAVGQQHAQNDADTALRHTDYAAWLKPRVQGMPWTAPAYDNLQPQGVPEIYCIAVDDGRCSCVTEQGTKYDTKPDICRSIARDGNYNPFRKPSESLRERRQSQEPISPMAQPREPQDASLAQGQPQAQGQGAGYWPTAGIPQTYDPPQHQIATGGR